MLFVCTLAAAAAAVAAVAEEIKALEVENEVVFEVEMRWRRWWRGAEEEKWEKEGREEEVEEEEEEEVEVEVEVVG